MAEEEGDAVGILDRAKRWWTDPEAYLAESQARLAETRARPSSVPAKLTAVRPAKVSSGDEDWQQSGLVVTLSWTVPSDLPVFDGSGLSDWYLDPVEAKALSSASDLRLVRYVDGGGVDALRLVERASGRMVSPSSPELVRLGLWVVDVRGEKHHETENTWADSSAGACVLLRLEPDCPYDPNAVGVLDAMGEALLGYFNKQKARSFSRAARVGTWVAVSLRGSAAGVPCSSVQVLGCEQSTMMMLLA